MSSIAPCIIIHDRHTTAQRIRASKSARALALALLFCACQRPARPPERSEPPPPILRLSGSRAVLSAAAWTELRALLTDAARTGAEVDEPLAAAKQASARFADDDDALTASFEALSRCETHACVARAEPELADALPWFVFARWRTRATAAWAGIEATHAALASPPGEALLARAANDLGTSFVEPAVVDVVSEAPPPRARTLVPRVLAARGSCFARMERDADRAVADARTLDCALVHVLLGAHGGAVAHTLVEKLGAREGPRAHAMMVVHVVASLVRSFEHRHVSVYLRSARAVDPTRMDWLAKEWSEGREPPAAFAARFAAAYE
jgi:hypothetical protein